MKNKNKIKYNNYLILLSYYKNILYDNKLMSAIISSIITNMSGIILMNISTSIYNINTYFLTNKNNGDVKVTELIRELDIYNKLRLINEFIGEIDYDSIIIDDIVKSINNCVDDIKKQLDIINYRLEYNKKIWLFTSLRTYGFDNRIKEINTLMTLLNDRFKMLVLLLSIKKN